MQTMGPIEHVQLWLVGRKKSAEKADAAELARKARMKRVEQARDRYQTRTQQSYQTRLLVALEATDSGDFWPQPERAGE